jgi:hypothetical protein
MVNDERGTRVARVSHLSPAWRHRFGHQQVWVLIIVFAFVSVLMAFGHDASTAVSVTLAAGLAAERISRSLTENGS